MIIMNCGNCVFYGNIVENRCSLHKTYHEPTDKPKTRGTRNIPTCGGTTHLDPDQCIECGKREFKPTNKRHQKFGKYRCANCHLIYISLNPLKPTMKHQC